MNHQPSSIHHWLRTISLTLPILIALAGCQSAASMPVPFITPMPSNMPSPTATPIAISAATPTTILTSTPLPTGTTTLIPSSPMPSAIPTLKASPLHKLEGESIFQECSPTGPCLGGLKFSPDGRVLAIGLGTHIYLWDVETGIATQILYTHHVDGYIDWPANTKAASRVLKVAGIDWTRDGAIVAAGLTSSAQLSNDIEGSISTDSAIALWNAETGQVLYAFDSITDRDLLGITSVAFSPDGTMLASGHVGGTVMLWDVASGKHLYTLEANDWRVADLAWSPDGTRLAIAGNNRGAAIWDMITRQKVYSLFDPANGVQWMAEGTMVLVAGGDSNSLWNATSGGRIKVLRGGMLSPDRTVLADGERANEQCGTAAEMANGAQPSDKSISLFNAATGERLLMLECFPENTWIGGQSFVWSPDGGILVAYEPLMHYACKTPDSWECAFEYKYVFKSWLVKH